MPHQILLRQLTRKLRPGTLAGFWQGRYTLQPWNEVANSAYSQPPVPQGQTWDTGADFGFAAHQHITNPSTGLDSIYQKHVWSRLGTVEPPEGSDSDGQAQAKALAAAAAFVTLQPAAAAAAAQDDEEAHKHKIASLSVPASLKPAVMPAAVLPFIPMTPLDSQVAADTDSAATAPIVGLGTIPEEAEEASLDAPEAAPSQAEPSAAANSQSSHACEALNAAEIEADKGEAIDAATTAKEASTSHATKLPESVAAVAGRQHDTAVSSHKGSPASASSIPAGKDSSNQHPAVGAGCSSENLVQQAERVAAKQLVPLPVLTALETSSVSRRDPHAVLSAAMHAVHAAPSVQDEYRTTASSNTHAETAVSNLGLMTNLTKAERSAAREPPLQLGSAAPLHSISHTRAVPRPSGQISRAVPAISCQVKQIASMSAVRPEIFAGESVVSKPIAATAAAATWSPGYEVQAKAADAVRQHAMQTAVPSQALKRKHIAVSAPAVRARRPAADAFRPVLAALELLLDADSIKICGHIPGLVIARGEICGRPVHACYLNTDSIAPSLQPAACQALCSMMDAAILVGSPMVTIHGSRDSGNSPQHCAASAAVAADLAAWMPAVQRHMDASGVVPQLAVSQGQLLTVSSLLASTCDHSFSVPGCRSSCRPAEHCGHNGSNFSQSGSRSSQTAAEHLQQHDSTSSSSSSMCCKQESSEQESPSIACTSMGEALHKARQLLAMLPSSNHAPAPKVPCHDPPWRVCSGLQHIQSPLELCTRLADAGLVAGSWAGAGTAVCFGRLDCTTVGFVAMPCSALIPGECSRSSLAQVIKTVRFCNAFNLPIISLLLLHDKEEAMPEGGSRMSDLANLIFAYSEAAVPKLAVVCGPEAAPAAKCLKSDVTLLWTSTTSMQPRGKHESPRGGTSQRAWVPASQYVSIKPEETRSELCNALKPLMESRLVAVPRRKHALLPKVC